jgi:hypothetical protein
MIRINHIAITKNIKPFNFYDHRVADDDQSLRININYLFSSDLPRQICRLI